jgi:bifunctional DNA-binding transcriptional regulator/antitoxin component of YhaV-PrlF toxin-antitoxin module
VSYEVVKVQARKLRPSGVQYLLTIPTELVRELGWTKGDRLIARVLELEIDGIKRKVLVYYKLQ